MQHLWYFLTRVNYPKEKDKTNLDGGDLPVLGEEAGQLIFGQFFAEVLDEDVGEALGLLAQLHLALLARNELANVDLKKR